MSDGLGTPREELVLGRLLRAGVLLSAGLLFVGLILWSVDHDSTTAAHILNAGIYVLMATPIMRLVLSLIEYIRERDWAFVAATIAVLAVLSTAVWAAVRTVS